MAPPVDDLGEHDSGEERGANDQQRRGPLATALALLFLGLRPRAELRAAWRWRRVSARLLVRSARSPLARAFIRLGFSLRRKAASLRSSSDSHSPTPSPRAAARSARCCRRSAPRSTRTSPLFTSSPVAPRPWRRARAGTRHAARPSSRPRRNPRRDRSRAACAACPDRCLTMTRPNLGATVTRGTGDAPASEAFACDAGQRGRVGFCRRGRLMHVLDEPEHSDPGLSRSRSGSA